MEIVTQPFDKWSHRICTDYDEQELNIKQTSPRGFLLIETPRV